MIDIVWWIPRSSITHEWLDQRIPHHSSFFFFISIIIKHRQEVRGRVMGRVGWREGLSPNNSPLLISRRFSFNHLCILYIAPFFLYISPLMYSMRFLTLASASDLSFGTRQGPIALKTLSSFLSSWSSYQKELHLFTQNIAVSSSF